MKTGPLKVLSVCTSDSSGGAARAAYRIHLAVQSYGIESKMFVKQKETGNSDVIPLSDFIPKNPFYRTFDWIRNKVYNKWQHYIWRQYPNRSSYFMSDLRSTDIGGALQIIDYDILHLHWINLRFLPLDKLPKDKPIVWTLHDSWPFCGVCHYFFDCDKYLRECGNCPSLSSRDANDISHVVWKEKRKIYKNLNLHIVTPSRWLGDCAKKSALLLEFPIKVIPNCIDTSIFRPLEEQELSPRWRELQEKKVEKPLVLYGAINVTTDKRKGFAYLLSALMTLQEQGDDNRFEMVVFGTGKPLDEVETSIPIHYVGHITDEKEIVSLYNLASAMVVPSLTENLSCTIMESLSCGTPVVAFNIGGNGDMIDHLENGYLAQERNSKDFAHGILWCLENNKDGHMSQNARQKVLDNFTPEVVGGKYSDLYKNILH